MSIAIKRQIDALKLARALGPTMTPQALQCLLEVALQPGITMEDLATALGLTNPSVSRNLSALGEVARDDKPGLDLVRTSQDPVERRRFVAFLTPKGQRFVADYLSIVEGTGHGRR